MTRAPLPEHHRFGMHGMRGRAQRQGVISLLREAESLYEMGKRGLARRRIVTALLEMEKRQQVLPSWVVEGCKVQWVGEGTHSVYTVVQVGSRGHDWCFVGERIRGDGSKEKMYFHPETGRRYWRRYAK